MRRIGSGKTPDAGGVAERFKAHAWKACWGESPSGVESPSLRHLLTSEHLHGSHDRGFLSETTMPDVLDPLAIPFSLCRQADLQITLELGSLRQFIIGE